MNQSDIGAMTFRIHLQSDGLVKHALNAIRGITNCHRSGLQPEPQQT